MATLTPEQAVEQARAAAEAARRLGRGGPDPSPIRWPMRQEPQQPS